MLQVVKIVPKVMEQLGAMGTAIGLMINVLLYNIFLALFGDCNFDQHLSIKCTFNILVNDRKQAIFIKSFRTYSCHAAKKYINLL